MPVMRTFTCVVELSALSIDMPSVPLLTRSAPLKLHQLCASLTQVASHAPEQQCGSLCAVPLQTRFAQALQLAGSGAPATVSLCAHIGASISDPLIAVPLSVSAPLSWAPLTWTPFICWPLS